MAGTMRVALLAGSAEHRRGVHVGKLPRNGQEGAVASHGVPHNDLTPLPVDEEHASVAAVGQSPWIAAVEL